MEKYILHNQVEDRLNEQELNIWNLKCDTLTSSLMSVFPNIEVEHTFSILVSKGELADVDFYLFSELTSLQPTV
jgi:hypothetical protein